MNKTLVCLALSLTINSCYAMFCPGNYNQININDSLEAVKQACGKPDTEKTQDIASNGPQEWVYFVKTGSQSDLTSLRMTVAFDKEKAANITMNGVSLTTTQMCGSSISVGDDIKSVEKACGKPALINQANNSQAAKTKLTELTYSSGNAPIILIFENDKLKERK